MQLQRQSLILSFCNYIICVIVSIVNGIITPYFAVCKVEVVDKLMILITVKKVFYLVTDREPQTGALVVQ